MNQVSCVYKRALIGRELEAWRSTFLIDSVVQQAIFNNCSPRRSAKPNYQAEDEVNIHLSLLSLSE